MRRRVTATFLARAFGMRVHALNRRGVTDEAVDWMGTSANLPELLDVSDVLMICAPLTKQTRGMIGAVELARMKPDGILVNVARGEIVDEDALYRHVCSHPGFWACIDAWWEEPPRHENFKLRHPFFELANVLGSPHNSAMVPDIWRDAWSSAANNIRGVLGGQPARNLLSDDERFI